MRAILACRECEKLRHCKSFNCLVLERRIGEKEYSYEIDKLAFKVEHLSRFIIFQITVTSIFTHERFSFTLLVEAIRAVDLAVNLRVMS